MIISPPGGQAPPYDLEAEQSVLGCMLMDNDVAVAITMELGPEAFYKRVNRLIFEAIKDSAEADVPVDVITIANNLNGNKVLEASGGKSYIHTLLSIVPTTSHWQEYVAIVRRDAISRQLLRVGLQLTDACYARPDEPEALLGQVRQVLDSIEGRKKGDEITGPGLAKLFESHQKQRKAGTKVGIHTGLCDLDRLTGGFLGGQLVIVAGRPKMGKSIAAATFALSAIDQGAAVLFASFELRADELADRLVSMQSGVPLSDIALGCTNEATQEAAAKLSDDLIIITGRSFGLEELCTRCKRIKSQRANLGLVVVDLLTHLKTRAKERRELEVATISRRLKVLAQELDVPVVAVSQLSLEVERRKTHRPTMTDLRESGALEQDADKVLLLYRREYYLNQVPEKDRTATERTQLKECQGRCEINVAAQRQGTNGVIYVQFDGACVRLRPLAMQSMMS